MKLWKLSVFGLLLALAACTPPQSGITGVSIKAPKTMTGGLKVQLEATVQGSSPNKNVTWSVEGGGTFSDPKANPVSFIAPMASTPTTVRVKATAAGDSSKSATAEIQVDPAQPLIPKVDPGLTPTQPTIPDKDGTPLPVAVSRDDRGTHSEFIEGQVLVRPKSQADLNDFLQRYDGTVLADDTIPEPPANLGITLTPEQRKPTEYLVRINLAKVNTATFAADAAQIGLGGGFDFSSEDGLRTLAAVTNAAATGFSAAPNYVEHPTQFPTPLLSTQERPSGGGAFTDAFATTRFQSSGSQSNVTLAWQFVAAHGIQRRINVAVIDGGFWLNTNGTPRGTDTDLPANPVQYDFVADDYLADGPNPNNCSGGSSCFWHGNGSAGVATGIINNRQGDAGTGGLVANPFLFKVNGRRDQTNRAIRTAVAWGADVVSMSFGGDCNKGCRIYDRDHTPFDDAFNAGSRIVFVAAAGNGDSSGNGYDVGDPHFVHPCIEDHVICVGALNDDQTTRIGYSNFGGRVDIFAPTNLPVMSAPASNDNNPAGPAAPRTFGGTSAATPFVAGVAAMVKAINPDLNTEDVRGILVQTAHPGSGQVTRYIDAYAAVRKAAEGRPGVKDALEPDDSENAARSLNPGLYPNLSLHTDSDRDFYRLNLSTPSRINLDFVYPDTLGKPSIGGGYGLQGEQVGCGNFSQESTTPRANGLAMSYLAPAGSYLLRVSGKLNAYNLTWSATPLAPVAANPDGYEANNSFAQATNLGTGGSGSATITPGDVDFYRFQSFGSINNRYLTVTSGFGVWDTDVPLTLTLYDQNGNLIASKSNTPDCGSSPSFGGLNPGVFYLKVQALNAGAQGHYRFGAGTSAKGGLGKIRDRIYQILHPGDPVEGRIKSRFDGYIFTHSPAVKAINLGAKQPLHLELLDEQGNTLAEGQPVLISDVPGYYERLNLGSLTTGSDYLVQVTRLSAETDPPEAPVPAVAYSLSWETQQPKSDSGNLIHNGDADDPNQPATDTGAVVDLIQGWERPQGSSLTAIYYNSQNPDGSFPTSNDPGPPQRGYHFFGGGPNNASSSAYQTIDLGQKLGSDWLEAINAGNVQFKLSGYLGGYQAQNDGAVLVATFLDADGKELSQASIGTVSAAEREDKTGLFLRQTDGLVPNGTRKVRLYLEFTRTDGAYNDGYADNLELSLQEFGP